MSAVHDGYALNKALNRNPLGGAALSDLLLKALLASGAELRPRFSFKRTEKDGSFYVAPVATPGVTPSYSLLKQWGIASDIKESCCRFADGAFVEAEAARMPSAPYELPDGRTLELGAERFKVPEVMFTPGLLGTFPLPMDGAGLVGDLAGSCASFKGLTAAVIDVVNRCDVDLRRDMYGGLVLTGGGSLFQGLKERLERDVQAAAPAAVKVKLLASTSTQERRFGVWLGGSILSSLGSFQQLWISKKEYEEHGVNVVHKRCP